MSALSICIVLRAFVVEISMCLLYEARHHKMEQISRFLNIEIHTYSYSRI